jgi:hypothetical protein
MHWLCEEDFEVLEKTHSNSQNKVHNVTVYTLMYAPKKRARVCATLCIYIHRSVSQSPVWQLCVATRRQSLSPAKWRIRANFSCETVKRCFNCIRVDCIKDHQDGVVLVKKKPFDASKLFMYLFVYASELPVQISLDQYSEYYLTSAGDLARRKNWLQFFLFVRIKEIWPTCCLLKLWVGFWERVWVAVCPRLRRHLRKSWVLLRCWKLEQPLPTEIRQIDITVMLLWQTDIMVMLLCL